jgi:hypothetical protein
MKNTLFKLTDQNLRTHGNFHWTPKIWAPPLKGTLLCAPGVYHAYTDPALALLLNPIHANIQSPRLWVAEYKGRLIDTDHGLKVGTNEMRLVKEIAFVPPTAEQQVKFALYCALEVYQDPAFVAFANAWLSGKDRTEATAKAAALAAWTEEATWTGALAAARAAAWAEAAEAAEAARTAALAAAAANKRIPLIELAQKAYPCTA